MLSAFSKYAGVIQAVLGVVGTAAPSAVPALGASQGGSIFNLVSGLALSYLGFKGPETQQRMGAIGLGGLNAVVGILGTLGVTQIAGITLNESTIGIILNLAIGAWGLVAGLMKKKSA
jgi:hypothetical protein